MALGPPIPPIPCDFYKEKNTSHGGGISTKEGFCFFQLHGAAADTHYISVRVFRSIAQPPPESAAWQERFSGSPESSSKFRWQENTTAITKIFTHHGSAQNLLTPGSIGNINVITNHIKLHSRDWEAFGDTFHIHF